LIITDLRGRLAKRCWKEENLSGDILLIEAILLE
jgi:hypothetical protein